MGGGKENDRRGTSDEGNGGREEIMMEKYRKKERKLQGGGQREEWDPARDGCKTRSKRWFREVERGTTPRTSRVFLLHPLASLCASPPVTHTQSL